MEHNNSENGVIKIDLSPLYPEFNEEIAHENYFRWTRQPDEEQTESLTLIRVDTAGPDNRWSNIQHPIDVSGKPSVHRILLIRDITKRLRDLDDARESGEKLFSKNSIVEIYFKLDDTEFSLGLKPTSKQPGNALLKMTGAECGIFKDTHKAIEDFECFRQLDAMTIDSIVTRARQTGQRIREDIDTTIEGEENIKKIKMAEQLTFFMLIYDFEIARRLQRPYVNKDAEDYDSLPIGIGIALNHLINKKTGNNWKFCSPLFVSEPTSRKQCLEGIMAEFKQLNINKSNQVWTKEDYVKILYKQFGVTTVQAIPQSKPHSSSLAAAKNKH